jgi:hypothetical protein
VLIAGGFSPETVRPYRALSVCKPTNGSAKSRYAPRSAMGRLLLNLLLLLSSSAYAEIVMLAGGAGQIDLPPGYRYFLEDGQTTLVVLPRNLKKAQIRFSFNSLRAYVKQRPRIGRQFVEDTAKKTGKTTFSVPGNEGVAFVDYTTKDSYGNDRVQETFGIMGLDDSYVIFMISIAEDELASNAAARDLSATGFRQLLSRIRSRGGA